MRKLEICNSFQNGSLSDVSLIKNTPFKKKSLVFPLAVPVHLLLRTMEGAQFLPQKSTSFLLPKDLITFVITEARAVRN